jgi:UPF0271 protein
MAVRDRALADAIARATLLVDRTLILLGLPGSELIAAGQRAGLRTISEGFADRAYQPDGSLLPRSRAGAVIEDGDVVVTRAVLMARDQSVIAADGTRVSIDIRTICVHGDTPGAAALARRIREALKTEGIALRAMGALSGT